MKARIQSWEIKELGPAFHYGQEHADGSHSYPAMTDLSLRIRVVGGDDARKFLEMVKQLEQGAKINRIDIETKNTGTVRSGRKYVFD